METNLSYRITRTWRGSAVRALGVLGLAPVFAASALAQGGSGGIGTDQPGSTGATPTVSAADGVFPIVGRHTYGDGLGAGRNHQGQDLMAKCGKPVVAAQAGRIQTNRYQASGAGNYIVVDGRGAIEDMVYMHLQTRSPMRKGSLVEAGDLLGRVGTTGRSSACHLHFEIWSEPGWYEGGDPLDPEPILRGWDRSA